MDSSSVVVVADAAAPVSAAIKCELGANAFIAVDFAAMPVVATVVALADVNGDAEEEANNGNATKCLRNLPRDIPEPSTSISCSGDGRMTCK